MDMMEKVFLLLCVLENHSAGSMSITKTMEFSGMTEKKCESVNHKTKPLIIQSLSEGGNTMCRTLFGLVADYADYQFDLSFIARHNGQGWPGIVFNAVDEDNFDFVMFPLKNMSTPDSDVPCIISGHMEKGVMNETRSYACVEGYVSLANWAMDISLDVIHSSAHIMKTSYSRSQEFVIQPYFPQRARIGLLVLNTEMNILRLEQENIFLTYQPHSLPNDTRHREEKQQQQLHPSKGPVAGGTEITITVPEIHSNGIENIVVKLGSQNCITKSVSILNSNAIVITPPYEPGSSDDEEVPLNVSLYAASGRMIKMLHQKFTYKPNPVIVDFYPKDTIVAGGSGINVTGHHLTSVETHVMIVKMIHIRGDDDAASNEIILQRHFNSTCHVHSDAMMTCPTPSVVIPSLFGGLNLTHPDTEPHKQRNERSSGTHAPNSHKVGDNRLMFYVGFKSDGVMSFTENTEKTRIVVYANPNFQQFPGNPPRMLFNPAMSRWLRLQGQHLRQGIRVGDYTVTIGMDMCTRIELTDNQLVCQPPETKPRANTARDIKDIPDVQVLAGYSRHFVGYLEYVNFKGARSEKYQTGGTSKASRAIWLMCFFGSVSVLSF